jgi:hypothetical protein
VRRGEGAQPRVDVARRCGVEPHEAIGRRGGVEPLAERAGNVVVDAVEDL